MHEYITHKKDTHTYIYIYIYIYTPTHSPLLVLISLRVMNEHTQYHVYYRHDNLKTPLVGNRNIAMGFFFTNPTGYLCYKLGKRLPLSQLAFPGEIDSNFPWEKFPRPQYSVYRRVKVISLAVCLSVYFHQVYHQASETQTCKSVRNWFVFCRQTMSEIQKSSDQGKKFYYGWTPLI